MHACRARIVLKGLLFCGMGHICVWALLFVALSSAQSCAQQCNEGNLTSHTPVVAAPVKLVVGQVRGEFQDLGKNKTSLCVCTQQTT